MHIHKSFKKGFNVKKFYICALVGVLIKWLGLVTGTRSRSVIDGEMYPHEPFFVYLIVNA